MVQDHHRSPNGPLQLDKTHPVRRFRVGQAVDGVDLAGRGPAGEFVDARLGDEQLAGLPVEPFVRLRARRPPPCTPASPADAMSYSPGSGLSSSYSMPVTPSASLAASSVTPARSAPPVDSRMESIASTALAHPDSLSTRLRVCSASLRVCLSCRSSHCRNGSGSASRTRLLGQDAGLLHSSANCMDGSSLFVPAWPYARGWVARCLPDESRTPGLERAEAPDRLPARVRPVPRNSDAVPGRGHAVPVGLHMPPRGRGRNASRATAAAPAIRLTASSGERAPPGTARRSATSTPPNSTTSSASTMNTA